MRRNGDLHPGLDRSGATVLQKTTSVVGHTHTRLLEIWTAGVACLTPRQGVPG